MIEMIKENALIIITALGGTNLIVTAASIVKTFAQKKMNKAFDTFNAGASKLKTDALLVANKIDAITSSIDNYKAKFDELLADAKEREEQLIAEIHNLQVDGIVAELRDKLSEVETLKQAIDMKDKLIEIYAQDLHEIKGLIAEIRGK